MSNYSILNSEEYKPVIDTAIRVIIDPRPNDKGVFAYDKKSGLIFEFECIEHALDLNLRFVIFTNEAIYFKDMNGIADRKIINHGFNLYTFASMMKK
jgi:hypothetical protein